MNIVDLGAGERLVDYNEAWEIQRRTNAEVAAGTLDDTLILVEHPSVYTAGRRTAARERPSDGTPVVDVDRGGRITWHGPGQLVVYPILRLAEPIDVIRYVRALEDAIITVCSDLGLATTRVDDRTGVWFPAEGPRLDRKVCAIGVRVAKGVTMHGIALNCNPKLGEFGRIIPCGIDDAGVTSLSVEAGRDVTVQEMVPAVVVALGASLADVRWNAPFDRAAREAP